MRRHVKLAWSTAISIPVLFVLLWLGYTSLKGYSSNPLAYGSCMTEQRTKSYGVAGWNFEVEYTNCDTLAKDEAIRVFAIDAKADSSSWTRFLAPRHLVLWYDPGNYDAPLPLITQKGVNQVLVTVPHISSMAERRIGIGKHTTVEYTIGHIDYR